MLETLPALAAWGAGAVLVVSGALKLGRSGAFRASLAALGLPGVLAGWAWFSRAFPVVEIVLGLAIVIAPAPLQLAPLAVAVVVYAVFLVVAVSAWRAPEPVDCECFGGLGASRMTGRTVVRNAALLALAVAGLAGGAPAALLSWPDATVAAAAASGLAAGLLAVVLVLVRDRRAVPGAESAVPEAPAARPSVAGLELVTYAGESIPLAEFARPATHLVFFSPSCISCHELVPRFRWWPNGLRDGEELLPVLLGSPEAFAAHEVFAPLLEHALYDPERRVAAALGRSGTPGHVLLDPEHPAGDGWTSGAYAIEKRVLRPDFLSDVQAGRIVPVSPS